MHAVLARETGCTHSSTLALGGYTLDQVQNAATGKTSSEGGLNKGPKGDVLKANCVVFLSSESSDDLTAKLQRLVNETES